MANHTCNECEALKAEIERLKKGFYDSPAPAFEELILAAKDACILISEFADDLGANKNGSPILKRLMGAITKVEERP